MLVGFLEMSLWEPTIRCLIMEISDWVLQKLLSFYWVLQKLDKVASVAV